MASGEAVLQRYGVSDDDAFAVGLTCGGILDVYVEKVNRETFPELGEGRHRVAGHEVVTVRQGGRDAALDRLVAGLAAVRVAHRVVGVLSLIHI